eukprot:gb/GECG01000907.1/.p1 GENE.gb/GECG01000907.1/~~gb/GECG01000907.1/.p1  ORF type:complete len:404 (+),score=24.25 gb/GECG01000907.1/:1-1212(+)
MMEARADALFPHTRSGVHLLPTQWGEERSLNPLETLKDQARRIMGLVRVGFSVKGIMFWFIILLVCIDSSTANGIGKQSLSNRPSSAQYRFGSGSREGPPERARSPGPVYDVPESIGKQALSSRRTSPHSKFGTSTRDERRIEHSPAPGDHDYREKPGKSLFGKNPPSWGIGTSKRGANDPRPQSPGPSYMVEGGIGKQVTSTRPSSANYRFGTSSRDSSRKTWETPGPGAHMYEEAPGKNLRGHNAPNYRFGSSKRDAGGPRSESPGPRYKIDSRPSSPSYKFGSSTRDEAKKASEGPGPASYMFEEPPGKNLKGQNAATFRFGTSSRDGPRRSDKGPGPGGYATMAGIGKQPISTKRTSSMSKFGSANRFPQNRSSETPSPADYYHVPKTAPGPAWTMLSR